MNTIGATCRRCACVCVCVSAYDAAVAGTSDLLVVVVVLVVFGCVTAANARMCVDAIGATNRNR